MNENSTGTSVHMSSLFPESTLLDSGRLVEAVIDYEMGVPPVPRLTMTLPLINEAENVIFLISGKKKIELARKNLLDSPGNKFYPASMVTPQGILYWFMAHG